MDKRVNQAIREYKDSLEQLGIRVKRIILYGSHALGNPKEWSDIDIVVISDNFKDMDLWERQVILGRAHGKIREPIEALGYTEEEYKSKGRGTFIGDEVKIKGIEIK
jgi:predicted nucleotidyltransferase